MAAGNFDVCLSLVLREEGGFTKDRNDAGNWTGGKVGAGALKGTNFGISAKTYPNEDIAGLTRVRATTLYRRDFWDACRCDELEAGVDLVIMDVGVNSGVGRGRAYRDATARIADSTRRVEAISEKRRAFYKALRTFARYGKVWLGRVARVEAAATKMVLAAAGKEPAAINAELERRAEKAKAAAARAKVKAGAAAAASASAGGAQLGAAPTSEPGANPTVFLVLLAVIAGMAVVVFLIHRARAQRERASAFAKAASEIKYKERVSWSGRNSRRR
jgi:lysozyme family protein